MDRILTFTLMCEGEIMTKREWKEWVRQQKKEAKREENKSDRSLQGFSDIILNNKRK